MSTGKLLSLLVLPWSLAVSVLFLDRLGKQPASQTHDDRLVYAATLDSLSHGSAIIVLVDSAVEFSSPAPSRVLRSVETRPRLYLVPRSVIEGKPKQDGLDRDYWTRFGTAFPDAYGWYELSSIDYRGRDEAQVGYGHHCGWLCGSGGMVELVRGEQGWKVVKVHVHWVS